MSPAFGLLAENSAIRAIGELFHPIFLVVAYALAAIYGVIPNYAIAIALLTIIIMAILTPLTVKSTKSMIAMQRMQPEIKKLQQKYKGPENREQLNQELMRLYKEQGINPASGCVPIFLQTPFLIILYDTIKGLTHTAIKTVHTTSAAGKAITHKVTIATPLYIPHSSKMYRDLRAHPGNMVAFHMNLALKPFSRHSSWEAQIPFFVFVVLAVGLQYFQMRMMNGRNPAAAQANPQMQTMQKFMPLLFAYIYFLVPAGVVIYMIVSTAIRIGTQDVLFRFGFVQMPGAEERAIPAKSLAVDGNGASNGKTSKELVKGSSSASANGTKSGGAKSNGAAKKASGTVAKGQPKKAATGSVKNGTSSAGGDDGDTDGATEAKAHPRSKAKRERKAR